MFHACCFRSQEQCYLILVQRPHQDFTCVTMLRQRTRSMADCLQFLERPTLPRSCSTWSNHLALCAPLRLVPAGFETNTILAGLLSGILTTCPAHWTLPDLATFWILGSP